MLKYKSQTELPPADETAKKEEQEVPASDAAKKEEL
jgi:hypothetical protein